VSASSDADDCGRIVMALASGASLCAPCIAEQTGISHDTVERLVLRVRRTVRLESGGASCDMCRTTVMVYRLP